MVVTRCKLPGTSSRFTTLYKWERQLPVRNGKHGTKGRPC